MYVQMLDIYISKISDIFDILENITIFSNPVPDRFQMAGPTRWKGC